MNIIVDYIVVCVLLINAHCNTAKNGKDELRAAKLPPCSACRVLTDSVKKGMERTERGKFEGGDTAWEEEKMGSYRTSEVRLVEIQEKLCAEVERGYNQCHINAEENEGAIEEWWFQHQKSDPDIYTWLCIKKLKRCCPSNHYGPDCLPCLGGPENPCSGNGKCKGAGTRKGNGECSCNPGYEGYLCNNCSSGYYEAYRDDNKLLCERCHKACSGPCAKAGPMSCIACNQGWLMDTEKGCLDINECLGDLPPCEQDKEFCVNNEGSYSCLVCDKSCDGCTGDGPDMCKKCANGYALNEETGTCVVSLLSHDTEDEDQEGINKQNYDEGINKQNDDEEGINKQNYDEEGISKQEL